MKKIIVVIGLLSLTACANKRIPGYEGPKALSQNDVITAARSCTNTKMKPNVVYLPQKTDFGSVLVPVDVHCDPYK
jgi:hypothetical protein